MIPNLALQKAIDGGWKLSTLRRMDVAFLLAGPRSESGDMKYRPLLATIALDPTFWQALGKGLEWEQPDRWKIEWHRFIDQLADGKDVESFFASL
jgi:hypothetical protein